MKGKTLSLCVSGKLWNRSLVMMDIETGSLWSHILGEAMQGELKGTQLDSLPCDMVTWEAWLREHPKTTVLNLSRHKKHNYTREFYRQPERFVLGFTGNYGIQHCSLKTLMKHPLLNADARGLPLLITFDRESTSARIYSRKLGDRQLTFTAHKKGRIRDDQTGSIWNRATGIADEGPLKGKRLEPHVGIISYTRAWLTFHSDSKEVIHADVGPTTEAPTSDKSGSRKAAPKKSDNTAIRLKQSDLDPFFRPPADYANDFADYRSPLKFYDGRAVRTAQDWQERRKEILDRWHMIMGPWPPLLEKPIVQFHAQKRLEKHTRHLVEVEVAPGSRTVRGYLLVPHGDGPFPAVVVVYYDPETGAGKGKELRDFGYQLANRGFVALSIGTPESRYYPNKENAQLQPLSSLGYAAANCHTALASLSYVDADRIGIVGHSYGGKWAMFASCLYDKFTCAAWSDGGIVFDEQRANVNYWEPWYLGYNAGKERQKGIPTHDNPRTGAYKQFVEEQLDLHELHVLMAPRPFLVSGGAEDRPERWKALNHTIAVNKLLGHTNRVAMTNRKHHSPTRESNEQIYLFFERFLKSQND